MRLQTFERRCRRRRRSLFVLSQTRTVSRKIPMFRDVSTVVVL